jgi:transposase-like protein
MNIHRNAWLTPYGRAEVVRQVLEAGRSGRRVGREARVTEKTVRKWLSRART